VATPAFRNSTTALEKSQPVLEYIRPYTPELTGWFHDFGQGTANYDANGHFARIQPIFNAFTFTDNKSGGVLTPQALNNKFDGLQTGVARRCPGAASQRAEDNSAPYTDNGNLGPEDCDPSLALPGP
jgi:phospholipid/cholesterol/gamma-HCH transport system substrate-binding protein